MAAGSPVTARRLALVVVAFLAAALVVGCGSGKTTTPGEEPPKRALDPRSEALRYFPADTEAIALLATDDAEGLANLNLSLGPARAWRGLRARAARSLRQAGIDPDRIIELSRQPAVDIELPQPEIVFGTVPGAGPPSGRILAVLATEQGVEMDRTFREAAEAGRLEAAGEFDGARLYRGSDLDFAVRDGVLIAADDINRLQQAIARRDGEREDQLQDAPITALMNELPEVGALRAYLGPGGTADTLLSLIAAAVVVPGEPPPRDLPPALEAALSARAEEEGRLAIDLIVKVDRTDEIEESAEAAMGSEPEEPVPVAIAPADLRAALDRLPAESPLRRLVLLAPLAGAAWLDGDTVHARLVTAE